MFGVFRWWRRRRYARKPFPQQWYAHLGHVAFYAQLDDDLRQRFHTYLKTFAWEKHFIGAGGQEIDDEIRVVVSAAAVRLVLHLGLGYYNRLTEIIVYPSHYKHPDRGDDAVVFGEAHTWGTVVLSWDAVRHGLANPRDGHDTATHEFAHVLDIGDGAFDGTPDLRRFADYSPWAKVMSKNFTSLRAKKKQHRKTLRSYGATNEAEFFAVATEAFFEKPQQMRERLPELYEQLERFYGFDPTRRV